MAEVFAAGLFIGAIWGWIDLARRILRRIRGEKPERKEPKKPTSGIKLTEDEVAEILIERANRGDQLAIDWLVKHNYKQVTKQ